MTRLPKVLLRAVRVALWCLLALTMIVSTLILLSERGMQRREQRLEQRIANFRGHGPTEWAAIAGSCQAYLKTIKKPLPQSLIQPSLPPNLAQLRPHFWEVSHSWISFEWSDDFMKTISLNYRVENGIASLWFNDDDADERRVWQESEPSQR